jgi:hypothetical protein
MAHTPLIPALGRLRKETKVPREPGLHSKTLSQKQQQKGRGVWFKWWKHEALGSISSIENQKQTDNNNNKKNPHSFLSVFLSLSFCPRDTVAVSGSSLAVALRDWLTGGFAAQEPRVPLWAAAFTRWPRSGFMLWKCFLFSGQISHKVWNLGQSWAFRDTPGTQMGVTPGATGTEQSQSHCPSPANWCCLTHLSPLEAGPATGLQPFKIN